MSTSHTPTAHHPNPYSTPPPASHLPPHLQQQQPSSQLQPSATPPPPPPKQPPVPERSSSLPAWSPSSTNPTLAQSHTQSPPPPAPPPHPHHQSPPPIQPTPFTLPATVTSKSKPDLHHLLTSPSLLAALLHHPSTQPASLHASLQTLTSHLSANQALAAHLQGLESQLQGRRDAVSARLLACRALERAWKNKQQELETRLQPWAPRELHSRLAAGIAECEALCDGVEESFLDDDGRGRADERETAEWVRRVREGRRTVALRRERRARWDEGRVGGWR